MHFSSRRRRLERGEFNWVIVAFLLGAAAAGYAVATFVPPWARNRRVTQAIHEAVLQAWQHKDERLVGNILEKRKKLWGKDTVPYGELPHFEQQDITITRDDTEKTITIELSYTVTVPYPFLPEKTREITYDHSETGSTLSPAAEEKIKGKSFLQTWFE